MSTFTDTISLLNSANLRRSLELTSFLSALEFGGGPDSPLRPLLHIEHTRLLAHAVLESRSLWYKQRMLGSGDLARLLNGVASAIDDERLKKEFKQRGERDEALYNLKKSLSRLAYIQVRPQENPLVAWGRMIALMETIPRNHLNEVKVRLRPEVALVPDGVQAVLGLSIPDIVVTALAVVLHFQQRTKPFLDLLNTSSGQGKVQSGRRRAELLHMLVSAATEHLEQFRLRDQSLTSLGGRGGDLLRSFANLFSRPIRLHRELQCTSDYRIGLEGRRLSSLDRYPLVDGEASGIWYLPNLRGFVRAVPDVVHFSLNERWLEPYQRVRGELLEVYLKLMVNARMPPLTVIPEAKWSSAKGEVAGPDLIIIDHGEAKCLVAIELKSRRMTPSTRFELTDEDIASNYADMWRSLKQIPSKLKEIYEAPGEYERYREDLDRARKYPTFYLGVVGEAPYAFGSLVEYQRIKNSTFPLFGFNEACSVMSMDTFERAVEVCAQKSRSISSVLHDYLEDCRHLDLNSPMPELFKGVELDENQSFGLSFLDVDI